MLICDFSEQENPKGGADVGQKKEAPAAEKPTTAQLARFLGEQMKEGPFTNLQQDQPDDAGETAFIGSWAGK